MATTPVEEPLVSYPIPDAIDPDTGWTVQDAGWAGVGTDHRSHIMSVPLDTSPQSRQARNVEMARLKFSPSNPKLKPGTNPAIYAALEEVRIRRRAALAGLAVGEIAQYWPDDPTATGATRREAREAFLSEDADGNSVYKQLSSEMADRLKTAPDAVKAAKYVLAAAGAEWWNPKTDSYVRIQSDYDVHVMSAAVEASLHKSPRRSKIRNAVHRVLDKYLSRANASGKAAIEAAYELSMLVTPPPPPRPESKTGAMTPSEFKSKSDMRKPSDDDIIDSMDDVGERYDRDEIADKVAAQIRDNIDKGKEPWTPPEPSDKWCNMEIVEPPLPNRLPGKMKAPGFRARDRGAVLAYPHRFMSDKSVFASKVIDEGKAAVLIDTSGSMSMSESQIAEIIRLMPGTVIATYSSNSSYDGWLYIVGRDGMWADRENLDPPGMGNGVDGPALRWLAMQSGPKFWVCDGVVTGINDRYSTELAAEAQMICMHNRIMRLDNLHAVIERFGKGKV